MSEFGLMKATTSRLAKKAPAQSAEVVSGNGGSVIKTRWGDVKLSSNDVSRLVDGVTDSFPGIAKIVQTVVDGQKQIAEIRAKSDAEVSRLHAEGEKVLMAAEAKVKEIEASDRAFCNEFDRKAALVREILKELAGHPEYDQMTRQELVKTCVEAIKAK